MSDKKYVIRVRLEGLTRNEDGRLRKDSERVIDEHADGPAEYRYKRRIIRKALMRTDERVTEFFENMERQAIESGQADQVTDELFLGLPEDGPE